MQITLKRLERNEYTESPQKNPIRFIALHQVGDKEYINSTNIFKCKDYFNDFVAHKHGHKEFRQYGMLSSAAVFDQYGGLSVLVYNITSKLKENIARVLQPFEKAWGTRVMFTRDITIDDPKNMLLPSQRASSCVLWFSPECFVSTFRISTLLLFIRNCNIEEEIGSYREACRLPQLVLESYWYPNHFEFFIDEKFDFPNQEKFWYWLGDGYNSVEMPVAPSYAIHDNGQFSWLTNMMTGDLLKYKTLSAFHKEIGVEGSNDDDEEELDFDEYDEEETT